MKMRTLPLALTALLAVSSYSHAGTRLADHGHADLGDLPTLLGGRTHAGMHQQPGTAQPIWWALDSALLSPVTAQSMQIALASGTPVVIIRGESGRDGNITARLDALLGLSADAAVLVFSAPVNGAPVALALDDIDMDGKDHADTLSRFAALVRQHVAARPAPRAAQARGTRLAASNVDPANTPDDTAMLPRMRFTTVSMSGAGRGYITIDSELVRDITAQGSRLLLINKSLQVMTPQYSGVQQGGEIVIPRVYYSGHQITPLAPGQYSLTAKLVDWFPRDSGRTELRFDETRTTDTNFGLSIAPEVGRDIAEKTGSIASVKLPGNFSFARRNQVTRSVSYSVTDYSVGSALGLLPRYHYKQGAYRPGNDNRRVDTLEWRHQLAAPIDSNKHYFRSNGANSAHSNAKLTPSMRGVTLELMSTWELPALNSAGVYEMTAGGKIEYLANPRHRNAPQQRKILSHTQDSQAWATWRVSAGSPYLTRFPTVRLTSLGGSGGCLVDEGAKGLQLRTCVPLPSVQLQDLGVSNDQWTFDGLGRYVNRHTGRCLSILHPHASAEVSASTCNNSTEQRWAWSADRLLSRYDGGARGLRLNIDRHGRLTVHPPVWGAPVISNPAHPLLKPWSTYPAAPRAGDFIQAINGPSRDVPSHYIGMPAISPGERWEPQLIRQAGGQ